MLVLAVIILAVSIGVVVSTIRRNPWLMRGWWRAFVLCYATVVGFALIAEILSGKLEDAIVGAAMSALILALFLLWPLRQREFLHRGRLWLDMRVAEDPAKQERLARGIEEVRRLDDAD